MFEVLAYPVSFVMKLWHMLVHGVFGVDAQFAWVIAVIGLVVTVRGLLLPFAWIQKRSAHRSQLMRPERAELERRYGDSTDEDDIVALQEGQKALNEKYGYQPLVGCIPPLIQLPVILGLYRMLLWISRPELLENHSNDSGGVGVLTGEDVASFRDSQLFDVPLPAYLAMSDERFAALGTTATDAWSVILPFLIAAAVFTTMNMGVTLYFNYKTLDWSNALMRGLFRVMSVLLVLLPAFILLFGTLGPLPFALVLYWVTGNLWTTVQIILLNIIMHRRWPEDESHRELREEGRQALIRAREARRAQRAEDRRMVRGAEDRGAARAQLKARREQEKQQAAEEKAQKKARRNEVSRARGKLRAEQFKQNRAEQKRQREQNEQGGQSEQGEQHDQME